MASTGSVKGSARSIRASPGSNVVAVKPDRATPAPVRVASRRTGRGGAVRRAAHSATAVSSSTSRAPATTATAVVPTSTPGRINWRTVAAMSSTASTWCGEQNSTARSGSGPSRSRTSPTTSPVASAASGCWDRAVTKLMAVGSVLGARHQRVGDDGHVALTYPTVGLDRAVLGEVDLGAHEAVGELPWLDLERLDVAGHLLALPAEHHLQHAGPIFVGPAAHQDHHVGRHGHRGRRR